MEGRCGWRGESRVKIREGDDVPSAGREWGSIVVFLLFILSFSTSLSSNVTFIKKLKRYILFLAPQGRKTKISVL